jgi:ribonucleoside-diphosphate reductase beta chain
MTSSRTQEFLRDESNRYILHPIKYPDIWKLAETHRKAIWFESDVNCAQDLPDWHSLTDDERHFIKYVLAFFAGSDGIVLENLELNFAREMPSMEVRAFYTTQAFAELIHSIVYSNFLTTFITDPEERDQLFHAIETFPCIKRKAEWAKKYMAPEVPLEQRVLAFACVEGIFFSGAFCAIFWLKERGLMPGLAVANELISRDEGLHYDFAILLCIKYLDRLPQDLVHKIVREAVQSEEEFITQALPCKLIGMNAELMKNYIRFISDRLLRHLKYTPLFNATQPFPFMEKICIASVPNFFEVDVSNYQLTTGQPEDYSFEADDDF